ERLYYLGLETKCLPATGSPQYRWLVLAPFIEALYKYPNVAQMIAEKATAEGGTDVSSDPNRPKLRVRALPARMQVLVVVSLVIVGAAIVWAVQPHPVGKAADLDTAISSQSKRTRGLFYPTAAQ